MHRKTLDTQQVSTSVLRPVHTSENEHESEKDQRTIGGAQRKKLKHQGKISLSRSILLGVNRPLYIKKATETIVQVTIY